MILYENLFYNMGSRRSERQESEVSIQVNSQIRSIIDYDPLNNVFIVNGTLAEPRDAGLWTVRVKVVFKEKDNASVDAVGEAIEKQVAIT